MDRDLEALQSWVGTDPVAVLVTASEMKAHIARGVLLGAAIPCSVWGSGQDSYFGHVVQMSPFPFRVMVHKDDEAEARELLAAQVGDEIDG